MNKQFEEWWFQKIDTTEWKEKGNYYDLDYFDWSMKWGIYLEFFDSVGIIIQMEWNTFDNTFFGMIRDKNTKKRIDFNHLPRPEAQKEAIKKAFELL